MLTKKNSDFKKKKKKKKKKSYQNFVLNGVDLDVCY